MHGRRNGSSYKLSSSLPMYSVTRVHTCPFIWRASVCFWVVLCHGHCSQGSVDPDALPPSAAGLTIVPGWKFLKIPLCHRLGELCRSSSSLCLSPSSFLADLMDNSELIRNVTLCGHLHHGKVRDCSTSLGTGFLFEPAHLLSP